jgi:hypothetical protein
MSEAELRLFCSRPLSQAFRYCFMVKPGIDIELILMLEWSQSRFFAAHAQRVYSPMFGRLSEPAAFCSGSGGGGGVDVALFRGWCGHQRQEKEEEEWVLVCLWVMVSIGSMMNWCFAREDGLIVVGHGNASPAGVNGVRLSMKMMMRRLDELVMWCRELLMELLRCILWMAVSVRMKKRKREAEISRQQKLKAIVGLARLTRKVHALAVVGLKQGHMWSLPRYPTGHW